MSNRPYVAAALLASLAFLPAAPAFADGEIQITHAKALAGNVTPGDAAGYPVTISIPGAFQLASNLFVAANKIGIQVTSANVTVDLNGFLMQGSNVAWYGIVSGADGVTIENGNITGFKFDGINVTGDFLAIDDMRIVFNGRRGVGAGAGSQARIRNSTVSNNGQDGIVCGLYCFAEGNHAVGNGLDGLSIASGSSIALNNIASDNAGDGIQVSGGLVEGSMISFNGEHGVFGGSLVTGSNIHNNANWGIDGTAGIAGYGNNRLRNNGLVFGGDATNVAPLHPNVCEGACPRQ